jgi:hypothetical protein
MCRLPLYEQDWAILFTNQVKLRFLKLLKKVRVPNLIIGPIDACLESSNAFLR